MDIVNKEDKRSIPNFLHIKQVCIWPCISKCNDSVVTTLALDNQ